MCLLGFLLFVELVCFCLIVYLWLAGVSGCICYICRCCLIVGFVYWLRGSGLDLFGWSLVFVGFKRLTLLVVSCLCLGLFCMYNSVALDYMFIVMWVWFGVCFDRGLCVCVIVFVFCCFALYFVGLVIFVYCLGLVFACCGFMVITALCCCLVSFACYLFALWCFVIVLRLVFIIQVCVWLDLFVF